jgi:hypothetical protein
VSFARVFGRAIRRIRSGVELWPGTGYRETFRNQCFARVTRCWWAFRTHGRRRRAMPEILARPEHAHLTLHRFRTSHDAQAWLERQPATAGL